MLRSMAINETYTVRLLRIYKYINFKPSRVVQLLNITCVQDLFEEDLYNELKKDIEEELGVFG